jgi:hypothetical protein
MQDTKEMVREEKKKHNVAGSIDKENREHKRQKVGELARCSPAAGDDTAHAASSTSHQALFHDSISSSSGSKSFLLTATIP